eukprot:11175783-Lingulodinium_polyedra.AAC.1
MLRQAAFQTFCLQSSQGSVERGWAALTRQATPTRSRMESGAKRKLLKLYLNGGLLLGRDLRAPLRKRRA